MCTVSSTIPPIAQSGDTPGPAPATNLLTLSADHRYLGGEVMVFAGDTPGPAPAPIFRLHFVCRYLRGEVLVFAAAAPIV